MRRCLPSLFCAAMTLLAGAAQAIDVQPPPGWTEESRTSDLVIFVRENEKVHVRETLAYAEVDAPPEKVFSVVTDFDNWPGFMPYTKESKIYDRVGANELITYQMVSPPLVSDRDYYLRVKLTHGTAANGGVFKSEWTCLPDYGPTREGVVRMRLNEGSWTYAPVDGGKRTRVTYSLLTHPGGSIPEWIVRRSSVSVIPDLFSALRKRLAQK